MCHNAKRIFRFELLIKQIDKISNFHKIVPNFTLFTKIGHIFSKYHCIFASFERFKKWKFLVLYNCFWTLKKCSYLSNQMFEMKFKSNFSILNGQLIYIEKSKLNIAVMWLVLIPLDRVTISWICAKGF